MMKVLWNNFKIAFAMFSKIPMPKADWDEKNMRYMLCFFPLIGAVIGGLILLAGCFGMHFGFQTNFMAALLTLIPVLVTGGIHVDGLLDTADALSSWQERTRRLEILKDPHAGAFAIITACAYFLAWFGAYSVVWTDRDCMCILALGFLLSRSFSGLGVVTFPKARPDGTVAEFSRSASELRVKRVLIGYSILLGIGMVWIQPVLGLAAVLTAVLVFVSYHHMALKYFGGTTGDLSGWFLCVCEVGMAVSLAVVSQLMGGLIWR